MKIIINNKFIKIKKLHKSCSWAIKNLKKTIEENTSFSKTKKYRNPSDNIIY